MRQNDLLELNITAVGRSGEGLGYREGTAVSVPRAVPGDTVQIRIRRAVKGHADAELIQVLKNSPDRVDSGCSAFDRGCGGCQWRQMRYDRQLYWKKKNLTDTLSRRAGLDIPVSDVIGMESPDRCRNKMSFLNRGGRLVFMQENSDKTIRLDRCPQVTTDCQTVFESLRRISLPESILQVHIRSVSGGSAGIAFFVKRMSGDVNRAAGRIMKEIRMVTGVGAASYRDYHVIAGKPDLEENVGGVTYRIPLNGFFQTNPEQSRVLQKLVLESVPEAGGPVLDLYCGAGFFTLPAARKAESALGIENNPESVKSAGTNAARNGIGNVQFAATDVAEALSELKPGLFQTVILDPPRSGCEPGVLKALARCRPKRVIYVSCSPESLARDLKELASGPYRVTACRPVDMFPQTFHLETVVCLDSAAR